MADSYVLDRLSVGRNYLKLKFRDTIQVVSISTDKFKIFKRYEDDPETLEEDEGAPSFSWNEDEPVVQFHDVIIRDHFNSLRRELTLYFDGENIPNDHNMYWLAIRGLKTATGHPITNEAVPFSYNYDNAPIDDATTEEPVIIQDFSIKNVSMDGSLSHPSAGSGFRVEESNPSNGSVFVDSSHNDGSIMVRFTERPNLASLHHNNVKVQRKQINGRDFRWKTLSIKMALDADEPLLYIYVPSLDVTPVYFTDGHEYFKSGYKYRVILSKNITS